MNSRNPKQPESDVDLDRIVLRRTSPYDHVDFSAPRNLDTDPDSESFLPDLDNLENSLDQPDNDVTDDGLDARTRANRKNAQKSTGPRTPEGKAISSRNAATHHLFAQNLAQYFPKEELARYYRWVDGVVESLHPVGDLELILARRAADIQFRLDRMRTAEFQVTAGAPMADHSLGGYVQKHKDPIMLLTTYDSRFSRIYKSTMDELRQLQSDRKATEREALKELLEIAKAHIREGKSFEPSQFGFVFSRELLFQRAHLSLVQNLHGNGSRSTNKDEQIVELTALELPEAA